MLDPHENERRIDGGTQLGVIDAQAPAIRLNGGDGSSRSDDVVRMSAFSGRIARLSDERSRKQDAQQRDPGWRDRDHESPG
jgi:hypothetical protein